MSRNLPFQRVSEREEEEEEEGRKSGMFYSLCLLSKKGPLAAIWVAGCCLKRLKKRQVTDTHIPSSVDKILLEGLPSVTYRILAYLLLGVVRIYSRKVEYLFQSCHDTVFDINRLSVGNKVVPFRHLIQSSYAITLPKRYELDAFQLEVAEGTSGGEITRNKDIILQDAEKDTLEPYYLDMNPFDEVSPQWEENRDAPTSPVIITHQETCSFSQTPDKVTGNWETSSTTCTPPDKVLSPHQMETDKEVSSPGHMKNLQTSKEKLRELRFTQEQFMDVDMIGGVDVELLNLINEYQVRKTEDGDGGDLEKAVVLQNHDHVILEDKEVPSPMKKAPNVEVPDSAGGTVQELLAVPTPAKKENFQRPRKRKCIIDETLVLDNQIMKQAINDASGLICKRRKAHTMIDRWRFSQIPTLFQNFLEPLIPCAAMELQHVRSKERTEKNEPSSSAATKAVETVATLKLPDAVSPRTLVDSRSTLAPGTPVRGPTSARVFESSRTADSDGEDPFHSYENVRKDVSVHGEEDHGPNLMDEMGANEGDSQELHKNKNGLSARTRTVARYLHQVMHKEKKRGAEGVSLLPILERKTRAENARFFFEVLVLTSRGLVNVMQRKPYDDVLLQETAMMDATLMNC